MNAEKLVTDILAANEYAKSQFINFTPDVGYGISIVIDPMINVEQSKLLVHDMRVNFAWEGAPTARQRVAKIADVGDRDTYSMSRWTHDHAWLMAKFLNRLGWTVYYDNTQRLHG